MSSDPSVGSPSARSSFSTVAEAPAELSVKRVKEIRKDYVTRHKEVSSILFGIDNATTSMPEPLVFSTPLIRHKSKIISRGATMTPTSGRRNGSLILSSEIVEVPSTPDNSVKVNGQDSTSPRNSFLSNFWETIVDTVTSPMAIFHSTDPESMDDDESMRGLKCYQEPLEEELEDDLSTLATNEIYNKCDASMELDEFDRRDALFAEHSFSDAVSVNSREEKDGSNLNISCLSNEGLSVEKPENGRYKSLFSETGEENCIENHREHFSSSSSRVNGSDTSSIGTYSIKLPSSEMDDSNISPQLSNAKELVSQVDTEKKKKTRKTREKDKDKMKEKDKEKDDANQSNDGSDLLVELRAWRDIELEADASFIRGLRQTRRDLEDQLELIRLKEQFGETPDL